MSKYRVEYPADVLQSQDPAEIARWAYAELSRVAASFEGVEDVQLLDLNVEPPKPRDGQLALADGSNWDPGFGAGYYGYRDAAWRPLEGVGEATTLGIYDLASFVVGVPTANLEVLGFVSVRDYTLKISESEAYADVVGGSDSTFFVNKNGVEIGTILFASGQKEGVWSAIGTDEVSFAVDDRVQIFASGTPNPALASIKFTLKGSRTI